MKFIIIDLSLRIIEWTNRNWSNRVNRMENVAHFIDAFLLLNIWIIFVACAMTCNRRHYVLFFYFFKFFWTFRIDCLIVITIDTSIIFLNASHNTLNVFSFRKPEFFVIDKKKHLERKYSSSSSRVWVVMRLFNCTCVVVVVCLYVQLINRRSVGLMKLKGKTTWMFCRKLY